MPNYPSIEPSPHRTPERLTPRRKNVATVLAVTRSQLSRAIQGNHPDANRVTVRTRPRVTDPPLQRELATAFERRTPLTIGDKRWQVRKRKGGLEELEQALVAAAQQGRKIRVTLPSEMLEKCSDDQLLHLQDVLAEYQHATSVPDGTERPWEIVTEHLWRRQTYAVPAAAASHGAQQATAGQRPRRWDAFKRTVRAFMTRNSKRAS
jgi:hypothetical protein